MIRLKTLLISILLINLSSCKEDQKPAEETPSDTGISTFYFIRHAEKDRSNPQDSDPELNQDGMGRAMHWAEILKDVELDAIYSTDFRRTSETAAATSVKKDIDVQYYDPRATDIVEFKLENRNKTVLVVGHSNTTPDFVNKMIDEDKYPALDDSNNGSLFIVTIINGISTSQKLNINCNCPD